MHKRTRPCLGTGHDDGDNGQEYVRSLRSLPYPTTQALSALMGGLYGRRLEVAVIHVGLSCSTWADFPALLCERGGCVKKITRR